MNVEGHTCKTALNVVGYQRSGQHGVAGWLMANLPSPSVFLNNLGPLGADRLARELGLTPRLIRSSLLVDLRGAIEGLGVRRTLRYSLCAILKTIWLV
jgi:hypothetical protein